MDACSHCGHDQKYYHVFRHAIDQRDPDALADVVARFRPLLMAWAHQRLERMPIELPCADIADEAFARAWSALSASGLDRFPNLAAVLGYLRACVGSVIVDRARSQPDSLSSLTGMEPTLQGSPEQEVLAELQRREIWAQVNRHVVSEQERIVVDESIALGLPPRVILRRHPDHFANAAAIYQIKRNLFDRLRRDDELRQLYEE